MKKNKPFLLFYIFLFIQFSLNAQQEKKPNILFIFADDLMFNSIGTLDDCKVKTPNLDRLMENGVSFSRTYNQGSYSQAVCIASRTMMVTGANLWKAASYSKKGKEVKKPEKYWPEYLVRNN